MLLLYGRCSSSIKHCFFPLVSPLVTSRFASFQENDGKGKDAVAKIWESKHQPLTSNDDSDLSLRSAQQPQIKLEQKSKLYQIPTKVANNSREKSNEMKFETSSEVDAFIQNTLHLCDQKDIANLMRISAKVSKVNRKPSLVKKHLKAIASQLKVLSTSTWSFKDIGSIVFGLQNMSGNEVGLKDVLSLMTMVALESTKNSDQMKVLRSKDISTLVYGLKNMTSENIECRKLLSVVAVMISRCNDTFQSQSIGTALYGLQKKSCDYPEVREVLTAMALKIRDSKEDLSAQAIANALYGLKDTSSNHSEVRNVISALTVKINGCKEDFTSQAVGNAMYGLKGMSSNCHETRSLLSALVVKIRECKEAFNAQVIGNALYGMQGMSSDSAELRAILLVLIPKVKSCEEPLSAQEVSNALYGMQGMDSDSVEVRAMLSVLIPKVESCKEVLSSQAMGNTLYGMQGMSSDSVEVRAMIAALVTKVDSSPYNLSSQEVGNAIYGLQNMSSDHIEVRNILSVLVKKLHNCDGDLQARSLSSILYGLKDIRQIQNTADFLQLLDYLRLQVCTIAENALRSTSTSILSRQLLNSTINTTDLNILCQSVTLFTQEMSGFLDKDNYAEWQRIEKLLNDELSYREESRDVYFKCSKFRSIAERRVYDLALNVCKDIDVKVDANFWLFSLFESDIVFRIPPPIYDDGTKSDSEIILNIEVDGVTHKKIHKTKFCSRKDKYLRSKGIFVSRMETATLLKMSDLEIEKWMSNRINDAKRSHNLVISKKI
jgi:hypothetical protein